MPFTVKWYIENEIIYNYASGIITPEDFRESIIKMRQLTASSSHPLVHLITDVGDIVQPLSPKEMIHILRDMGHDEKTGWTIMLREKSMLVKMGVGLGTSLFKTRTRSFNTIEEAEAFLKQVDTTLSWSEKDPSVLAF